MQALANELKVRGIDLARYMELKAGQDKFNIAVIKVASENGKKIKRLYQLPMDANNVTTTLAPLPPVELVK